MTEEFRVGMAEYHVAHEPCELRCIGLGSCIAIALYDATHGVGGLGHVMLPHRADSMDQAKPGKFADSCLDVMLEEMLKRGASRDHIQAKIFGGANMFHEVQGSPISSVGVRNAEATKAELQKRNIAIVAEDVGGTASRSLVFDISNGAVSVQGLNGHSQVY